MVMGPNQFRGTYNGQNFTISGLHINRPDISTVGLFGSTYQANISNLGLVNVNITGNGRVGALVGQHDAGSIITNCYSTGNVSGNSEVGGLVGYIFQSAEVHKSHSTATVTANTISGGLAGGLHSGGIINECYATGSVTNASNGIVAGGLVGSAMLFSQINKSYARGSVNAGQPIGGLVGSISSSFVSYCYSTGLLTSASPYRGGLVGESLGSAEVNNSFWDITTSTAATSSGGLGRSTAQMKEYATFFNDGWDYIGETTNGTNDFWGMNPTNNSGYPFLAWQGYVNQVTPVISTLSAQGITGDAFTGRGNIISLGSGVTQHGITWNTTGMPNINTDSKTEVGPAGVTGTFSSTISGLNPKTTYYFRAYAANAFGVSYGDEYSVTTILEGDGTIGNPYLIATWEDIQWMVGQSNNPTVLAGYFLQVADIDAEGGNMAPIGRRSNGTTATFNGIYDGNGHKISNVVISYPGQNSIGFIGSINGGEVKRLGLINFSVTGANYVGALTGGANNATITECYATGVSATAIGWGGGLIGVIGTNTIVSKCYTTGNITGTGVPLQSGYIGGLVGYMGVAEVNNSYTHVHVAGTSEYSGGFTGFIDGGTIINSYSTGTVAMGAYFTSGFVGWDLANTVIGSFWDTESSGRLNSRVGVGLTTAQMTQYLTFYEAGWDLVQETVNGTDDIWGINPAENNGYPFLMWQGLTPSVTYPPSATTLAATNIENDKATLNGNLTRLGIPTPTSHGFVWNTTGNPNIAVDNVINLGAASSTGAFSFELTGIQAISTYYYRAFVTTDLGTFTGHVQTFKTVLEGSGTEGDPYKIVSLTDLLWIRNNSTVWDKHFEQVADIDASLTSTWHSGAGFMPIPFSGHYDGKGHSITGLYINRPTTDNQGLFSSATNATIINLSVLDANINGKDNVGIIVGSSNGATITNCNTSGTVNGNSVVGGIVGRIDLETTVSNCNSSASVITRSTFIASGGGIVGGCYGSSTIQSCTFNGIITGHTGERHGGIVGAGVGSLIIDCETNATITSSGNNVGGIAGSFGGTPSEIRNCNAMGTTQGKNEVGGLVGRLSYSLLINSQSSGNVIGHTNVGGLVGALRANGLIENTWSNAHVTGVSRVGGAVGEAKDNGALVLNSYSTGKVEGTTIIGGFVGAVETFAIVQTSYSTATVIASSSTAGGFAGRIEQQGRVFDSYSLGSVIGSNLVGGFAGAINTTNTQVLRCFSGGKTTSTTGNNVTAFAGNAYQATVQYNLADLEAAGLTTVSGASGKTNTEMRTLSTYLSQGWDFIGETTNGTNNIWGINGIDNQGYAFLAWQGYAHSIPAIITTLAPNSIILGTSINLNGSILELNGHTLIQHGFVWNTTGNPNIVDDTFHNFGAPGGVGNFSYTLSGITPSTTYYLRTFTMNSYGTVFYGNTINYFSGPVGEGTEAQPFLIASLLDLKWLMSNSQHWDKHYLQIADIDAAETLTWDGGKGITEIGNFTNRFTGTYDGGNKSITKMNCKRISGYYIGMFGYINNATIKNLTLEELYMEGSNFVGGLVGFGAGTNTINNCKVSGIVRGWNTIGGLIGVINGTVGNCHFVGEVRAGHNYVGGLIGRVDQAVVVNSSANAQVTAYYANAYAGGFAGTTTANATITKSWSNSNVFTTNTTTNTSFMGGFVGRNLGAINNCYAMGSITTYLDANNVGGFIGNNTNTAVRNSYSTVQINGSGTSVGGAIGVSSVDVVGNLLWDVTASGVATSAGGSNVVGKTTAEMNDINTYLDATFDFMGEYVNGTDNIWGFNPAQNNSYPFLAWQSEFEHKFSPTISIASIDNVTSASATINAVIEHLGDPSAIAHGFCWNTTGNPDLNNSVMNFGEPTNIGAFSHSMSYLIPNQQYFVRAYISDESNTYYSSEFTFTTPVKEIAFSGSFSAYDKVYDGTRAALANIDELLIQGVVIGATGIVLTAMNFEFETQNAGNNISVSLAEVIIDGVDKDRYSVNISGVSTSQANITPKAIAIIADAKIKVYGDADPALSYVVTGLVGGDTMSGALTRAAGTGVGTYAINQGTLSAGANYTITYAGALLTITAKPITVVADAKSKVYGAADPAFTYVVTGLVGADAMSGALTRAAGTGVGTYEINQGTLSAGANYTITYTGALLTITQKSLTITANSFNKTLGVDYVFDGDEFFTSEMIAGDVVTSVTLTSDGADAAATVGNYDIIPSNAIGTGLNNYSISYVNGILTVVDQTEVTLTGIIANNKVYDGTNIAEISTWGSLVGVAGGDVVDLYYSSAIATFNTKNVGINKVITITGLALSGADADKYYINNHITNANITVRDLTLSNFHADDKVYNGEMTVISSGFDDNRIEGDILTFSFMSNFEDKNAGENKTVLFSDITISGGADMNNYNLTVTSGSAYADIFTREVTVVNAIALDKVYDGFDNAEVINAELFNFIIGDDVLLEDYFFGFFAQSNVGQNISIETQMSLSGDDISNYELIQPDYLTADITPKGLVVINAVANNKIYDATTDASIVGAALSGVIISDDVSLENETIGEFAQAGVGVDIEVATFMTLSGDDIDNYYLTQPELYASILHKEISIAGAFEAFDKVYDGNNIAEISVNLLSIDGTIAPDVIDIDVIELAFDSNSVGNNILVSITNIEISGDTDNYVLSLDNLPYTHANITPAQLNIVNAVAQDKVYDGTTAAVIAGAELSGVIGDDLVILENNTVGVFAQASAGVDIEVISNMTISGADQGNYTLIQPVLNADITAKPLTITALSFLKSLGTEFVFDGDEFFVSEMIAGDEVIAVTLTSAGAPIGALEGEYDIVPSDAVGIGLENYDITYINGTLSVVDQVELFISGLVVADKVYDGTNIATVSDWGSLNPIADEDDVELDLSGVVVTFANKQVGNNKVVSITGLALSGANADNYFINNRLSYASITARTLVLSNLTADDKQYD
ncbi:MAG: hypothetical protein KGZ97_03210, partial [Bacteroidetes bacterium]|nr:hypothetical protein [Bacteroidota bacterium]